MGKLTVVGLMAFAVSFGALGEYVCGRILLPEVGLTAPQYWTWFWFMFFAMVFSSPLWVIRALLD